MKRRTALIGAGVLAAGAAAGIGIQRWGWPFGEPRLRPVNVSPDRVMRTIVGHRPYRRSGFRVEREPLGDKTIVHNYGHGGGGISLSWGSAMLAVEELAAGGSLPARVAVLGAGAIGLSTARLLQQHGVNVALYAKALPPETTSNIAAAQWNPFLVSARGDFFERAARYSHGVFAKLVGPEYGVHWRTNYVIGGGVRGDSLRDLFRDVRELEPHEHTFPAESVSQFVTLMIETPVYLAAVLRDFRQAGGRIEIRAFADFGQLLDLPETTIMNCTGLGARGLFGDADLVPVKGQLTILKAQPEIDYVTLFGSLYMMPRADGILLGGTYESEEWSMAPNLPAAAEILTGHARFFAAMRGIAANGRRDSARR